MPPDDTPLDSDDAMTRMLTASAPRTTPLTPAVEDELARMSVAARTDTRPAVSRKRLAPRVAAVALAGVLALGGAGAAAAATGDWWSSWWGGEPDGVLRYTLPSGAACEHRIGGLMTGTANEEVRVAAREWFDTVDLAAEIDVEAELEWIREDDVLVEGPDGELVPAEVDPRTEDSIYSRAVTVAIDTALTNALERQGFDLEWDDGERGLSWEGEAICPGADW
jgi:hypothetical protein